MEDLPPYARVLAERTGSSPKRTRKSLDNSDKESYISYRDELAELRNENNAFREMILQFREQNRIDKTNIMQLQQQVDAEKQINQSISRIVNEMRNTLSLEKEKNQALLDQISQLDKILENKTQVSQSREIITANLQKEYTSLLSDYNQVIDTVTKQASQLQKSRRIIDQLKNDLEKKDNELQLERTSPLRVQSQIIDIPRPNFENDCQHDFRAPPMLDPNRARTMNDIDMVPSKFQPMEHPPMISPPQIRRSPPQSPPMQSAPPQLLQSISVGEYSPLRRQNQGAPFAIGAPEPASPPVSPTRRNVPAALNDSISFGNDNENENDGNLEMDFEKMDVLELKKLLTDLTARKEFVELMLSKSAPHGSSLAQTRRERESWEAQLDTLLKQVSAIRLKLRRMREL